MPEKAVYDIAIVGGGLAGLCLALQAANATYSVILFEKETYPYHKVCGEYISLESRNFLERLGVPLSEWEVPIVDTLQTTDIKGKSYTFKLPLGGFGISRYKLDNYLYGLALKKGVIVKCDTRVNEVKKEGKVFAIEAGGTMYYARMAAGSFGKRSNLDVKWNRQFIQSKQDKLNNYVGIKYHIKHDHDRQTIALHNFSNGYCGMSAIEDGMSCLCYLTTAQNLKLAGNSIEAMEKSVLSANPALKKIFETAEFLYEKPVAISQISFSNKTQVENGVLLMGDAAGMITPLCGNGMSMAMHSSKILFECLQHYIEGRLNRADTEAAYALKWKQAFATRLWVGRRVQQVFGGNYATSIFLRTMNTLPFVARQIIAATHGKPF